MAKKCARTDKSDTEGGGEAGTSQLHSRHKKGHMTNIQLRDSDEEAIVEFVKESRSCMTNEHYKDKVRKGCLWERFANSRKLSVKVCKTGLNPERLATTNSQSKSGQAPKEMTEAEPDPG